MTQAFLWNSNLPRLAVQLMISAARTELSQLYAFGVIAAVLDGCIVARPAFRAGHANYEPVFLLGHGSLPLFLHLREDTGAHRTAAFSNSEAQTLL